MEGVEQHPTWGSLNRCSLPSLRTRGPFGEGVWWESGKLWLEVLQELGSCWPREGVLWRPRECSEGRPRASSGFRWSRDRRSSPSYQGRKDGQAGPRIHTPHGNNRVSFTCAREAGPRKGRQPGGQLARRVSLIRKVRPEWGSREPRASEKEERRTERKGTPGEQAWLLILMSILLLLNAELSKQTFCNGENILCLLCPI